MLFAIKFVCKSITPSIFNLIFIIIFGVAIYIIVLFALKDDFLISNIKLYFNKFLKNIKHKGQ